MMNYENAPTTELLSTRCAACARPLVDAASVTAGMGPICRKKYGYGSIPEDVRIEANALIHEAARDETSAARRKAIAAELDVLGADVLAGKIRDRFLKPDVTIAQDAILLGRGRWARTVPGYVIKTRYSPAFNEALKARIDWTNRGIRKNPETGKFAGWTIEDTDRSVLWDLVREYFAGGILETDNGTHTIPRIGNLAA
jgi:hypothetical protein